MRNGVVLADRKWLRLLDRLLPKRNVGQGIADSSRRVVRGDVLWHHFIASKYFFPDGAAERIAPVDEALPEREGRGGERPRALDRLELDEDDLALLDPRALHEAREMRVETHVVSAVNGEIEQGQKIFPQHLEKSAVLAA